jgi:hypothetical protein
MKSANGVSEEESGTHADRKAFRHTPENPHVKLIYGTGGRPRIEFDLTLVRILGGWGASGQEMASAFGVSRKTICDHMVEGSPFHAAYHQGFSEIKARLRSRQIQLALSGNERMLTWLGMQMLDQHNVSRDDVKVTSHHTEDITFTVKPASEEWPGASTSASNGSNAPNRTAVFTQN